MGLNKLLHTVLTTKSEGLGIPGDRSDAVKKEWETRHARGEGQRQPGKGATKEERAAQVADVQSKIGKPMSQSTMAYPMAMPNVAHKVFHVGDTAHYVEDSGEGVKHLGTTPITGNHAEDMKAEMGMLSKHAADLKGRGYSLMVSPTKAGNVLPQNNRRLTPDQWQAFKKGA